MTKDLWINLPVKDVKRSRAFFEKLGFEFNPRINDDNMACMFVGDKKVEISDTQKASEVLISFDAESREEVDALAAKANDAGGKVFGGPGEKQGWMYGCGFTDLDGHRWNALYIDLAESKMPPQPGR